MDAVMKQVYALLALGLVLAAPATAPALPRPLPAEKNDYCQDEAIQWVKNRFGRDTKILESRIDKSGVQEKEVKGWRVLVATDRCDGFFTMDYGVRASEECKKPQLGEREPMLMMVGATSGCKQLLPRAEYPSGRGFGGRS
jgi:hypothetical protein